MIELLAPAGNLEKLKFAFEFGADAVYLGLKNFSLRNLSGNFTLDELKQAKEISLKLNKKIYLTINVYPYNEDIEKIIKIIEDIRDISPDAIIISDFGIVNLSSSLIPNIPIHLSTQANTTNYLSAQFWQKFGIKRVNVARELSINDIKSIKEKVKDLEIEVFIHGAMCMSISGRCLLSNFLTSKASNKGECTHPCRWKYFVFEETRQGEYFPLEEDSKGVYIFNSKDLCGINFLPDLIKIGVNSLKIEGRMKSIYYLANVVRVYREAINDFYNNPKDFKIKDSWIQELNSVSNRGYTQGFFRKRNEIDRENFKTSGYVRKYQFIGVIKKVNAKEAIIEARNKILKGETGEVITKKLENISIEFKEIYNLEGKPVDFVQPMDSFILKGRFDNIPAMSIIRKKVS